MAEDFGGLDLCYKMIDPSTPEYRQFTSEMCKFIDESGFCKAGYENYVGGMLQPWIAYVLIAVTISFSFIGIAYMIGEFTRNERTKAWVKEEFYQVFFSAVFAFMLIPFTAFLCTIDPSVIGSSVTNINLYQLSCVYFSWLQCKILFVMKMIYKTNAILSFLASFTTSAATGNIGVNNLAPYAGLGFFKGLASVALSTLSIAYVSTLVQAYLLSFISHMALPILLPIGIVLRSFGPTRKFGGGLMGLAIGLVVFYPLLIAINYGLIAQNGLVQTIDLKASSEIERISNGVFEKYMTSTGGALPEGFKGYYSNTKIETGNPGEFQPSDYPETSDEVRGVYYGEGETPISVATSNAMQDLVNPIIPKINAMTFVNPLKFAGLIWALAMFYMSTILIAALFLPALNFILLIMAVREISGLLGQPVDVSQLARLI